MAIAVPTPVGDPFELACATYPKLWPYLVKNAPKHKVTGQPMSPTQYGAWLLAGSLSLR